VDSTRGAIRAGALLSIKLLLAVIVKLSS